MLPRSTWQRPGLRIRSRKSRLHTSEGPTGLGSGAPSIPAPKVTVCELNLSGHVRMDRLLIPLLPEKVDAAKAAASMPADPAPAELSGDRIAQGTRHEGPCTTQIFDSRKLQLSNIQEQR